MQSKNPQQKTKTSPLGRGLRGGCYGDEDFIEHTNSKEPTPSPPVEGTAND